MLETYFDSTSLAPTRMAKRSCPVLGCTTSALSGGTIAFCREHGLHLHTKTFRYDRPERNIRFERSYFDAHILGNPLKAESRRFDHENSEDALTWNVLACLARNRRLAALVADLPASDIRDEPELYLWGLGIRLDSAAMPSSFPLLVSARTVFEAEIRKMHTEPDILLYYPGKVLMLVEAKFTSMNTLAEGRPEKDQEGEKPKSAQGILKRYSADKIPSGSLVSPPVTSPFYSQLYRNLVFAVWMANELKVDWRFVNLVSRRQSELRQHPDPTSFVYSVLPSASHHRFRRQTWEELYARHVRGAAGLEELDRYIRYKTADCAQAFDL